MAAGEAKKATLTVKEAAEIMGVSYATMNQFTWVEGFPVIQAGRKKLIPRDAFFDWMNSQCRAYDENQISTERK